MNEKETLEKPQVIYVKFYERFYLQFAFNTKNTHSNLFANFCKEIF